MIQAAEQHTAAEAPKLAFFERYLSVWVALCMAAGMVAGKLAPAAVQAIRGSNSGEGARSTCRLRC
jgi:ACR3 family arsenite efflux pump ArsB